MKVQDTKGLSVPEKHALSKALHQAAAKHAEHGEVCAFNLVDTCQVPNLPITCCQPTSNSCLPETNDRAVHCRPVAVIAHPLTCLEQRCRWALR